MKTYFEQPKQVRFWDGEDFNSGIAFGNTVICGCCGNAYNIKDICEQQAPKGYQPLYAYRRWVDLIDSIGTEEISSSKDYGYLEQG